MIDLQIIGIGGSIGMGVFLILCGYAAGREWVRQFEAECRKRDAIPPCECCVGLMDEDVIGWPTRKLPSSGDYRDAMP